MSTTNGQEPGKVATENGDGLATPRSQPAEQHTKDTTDFIAITRQIKAALIRFASWLAVMFRGLV